MTKKIIHILLGVIFLAGSTTVEAQPQDRDANITIQDLEPQINYTQSSSLFQPIQKKSGLALISSAIVPGSGQAANKKWVRAGLYFLAEAVMVGVHLKSYNDAKTEHRRYKQFANNNWSVVNYAQWLVEYHDQNNLTNSHINELEDQVSGVDPTYDPDSDWNKVPIELLRNVERNTPFVYPERISNNNFSHTMPEYGSQQYYELISKYYQYGPGWDDFNSKYKLNWDGSGMPEQFMMGSQLAEDFNDSYRLAGNMVSLIILNHIISAFDAFLTVKMKNKRIEADTNFLNPHNSFSLKIHF